LERIIAAAVQLNGVTLSLPPPARHFHIVNSLCETLEQPDGTRYAAPDDQGFLTDAARFVGRVEALEIATAAGQIIKPTPHRELFSEDVW
jgi:hypothetical protein